MSRRLPSLTQGMSFAALSFGGSALLSLVTSIVLARVYGIAVVGHFALASAPVGVIWYLSTVREQPAMVRELARHPPGAPPAVALFLAVTAFSTALTLVVSVAVMGIAYLLYAGPIGHPELFAPALVFTAGYAFVTNPGWNLDAVYSAYGDGRRLFWIRLNQSVVFLVGLVALSEALPSVWGPVTATIVASGSALVHRLLGIGTWMRLRTTVADLREARRTLGEVVRFGLKMTPGFFATGMTGEFGTWTLGIVSSVANVGAWNRAWSVSRRVNEANPRIGEILFPALVRRALARDSAGFDRAFVDALRYTALALFLPAAVAAGMGDTLMSVFGSDFRVAGPALALTLLTPALWGLMQVAGAAMMAVDRPAMLSAAQIACAVATAAVTVPATLTLGVTGPAVGLVAGSVLGAAMLLAACRRHLVAPLHRLWRPREWLALAVAYAGDFAIGQLIEAHSSAVSTLVLGIPATVGFYVVAVVACGGVTERDRERLRGLAARLPGRRRARAVAGGAA